MPFIVLWEVMWLQITSLDLMSHEISAYCLKMADFNPFIMETLNLSLSFERLIIKTINSAYVTFSVQSLQDSSEFDLRTPQFSRVIAPRRVVWDFRYCTVSTQYLVIWFVFLRSSCFLILFYFLASHSPTGLPLT